MINNASITATGKRRSNLINHVDDFIYIQNTYKVNAVFAIAVAIQESAAGTNAVRKNNWFSVKGSNGYFIEYSSASVSIKEFGKLISSNTYFGNKKITIGKIAPTYCDSSWGGYIASHMNDLYSGLK